MQLSPLDFRIAKRAIPHTRPAAHHFEDPYSAPIRGGVAALENRRWIDTFELWFVALLRDPLDHELLTNLASLCRRIGWLEYAELFYAQAVVVGPDNKIGALRVNLANILTLQHRYDEARALFEQTLDKFPSLPGALRGLCEIGLRTGDAPLAEQHADKLEQLATVPFAELASFRGRLALVRKNRGAALEWLRSAIRNEPMSGVSWRYFVEAAEDDRWRVLVDEIRSLVATHPSKAQSIAEIALAAVVHAGHWEILPTFLAHLRNIVPNGIRLYELAASALYTGQDFSMAIELIRDALLVTAPASGLYEMGAIAHARRAQFAEAQQHFIQAMRAASPNGRLLVNASLFFCDSGRIEAAILLAQRALIVSPQSADACFALANAYHRASRLHEAEEVCRKALASSPLTLEERSRLMLVHGATLMEMGRLVEAEQVFRIAALTRGDADTAGFHALAHLHHERAETETLIRLHYDAGRRHLEEHASARRREWPNSRLPNRVLRIGIVSADLRHRAVGLLLASWLPYVDKTQFEIYCYATSAYTDDVTDKLRLASNQWRAAPNLPQQAIADLVAGDQIDILIDLAGFNPGTNLGAFAIKPAPVQLSWAGYPFTTGLPTIDGAIFDRFSALPSTEAMYVEPVLRLGCMSYCYEPATSLPAVEPTPALRRGYITFGCFNHVSKLSRHTLRLWARVLRAIPTARLFLKSESFADPAVASDFGERLLALGIAPERVRIEGPSSFSAYLEAYSEVDIALDTFPVNGRTTSLQALWQGVPLLTRSGPMPASRIGGSIMHGLNLSSWVADSDDQFVNAAKAKVLDFENLNRTRMRLRERLSTTTVGNGRLFALRMQQLWRDCWYSYCRQIETAPLAATEH